MNHARMPVVVVVVVTSMMTIPAPPACCADAAGAVEESIVPTLRRQARDLARLVETDIGRAFVRTVNELPPVRPRTVYVDADGGRFLSATEHAALPLPDQAKFQPRALDDAYYYQTRYGNPLIYARPIDLLGDAGVSALADRRVLDFGYGMIGQLRMMALMGADVIGVEVNPLLPALYSAPGDTGVIAGRSATGKLHLVHGSWPGDGAVRTAVDGGFDLIVSKNVLKRGYLHPEREADPRAQIDLGVDDATFVAALFDVLRPGGLVLIYNISPAQNPPNKPFIPWADGRCPFDRAALERAGFEVLAYDRDDQAAILDYWQTLGLAGETASATLRQNLFAHYTLLRRPAARHP